MSSCCSPKIRPVSMGSMSLNFALSVFNAINHAVKTKKVLAAKNIVEDRIKTCKGCEQLKLNRCQACGCYIVVKAGMDAEKCPEGKW